MHLYLATDAKRKSENKWFLGVTRSSPDKIKEDLTLDRRSGNVDFVIESPQAKEILAIFQDKINHTVISERCIQVEGDHARLAQLIIQMTRDYEADHPSLRRSVARWLRSVDS